MSPVNSLWFKWKSLRLPWRRSFLVGSDLSGNTYWEFKDTLNSKRFRRIVKFSPKTHYADVQVTPQWHQWLRYVRAEPPSIEEQQQDIIRQLQIKQLARLADERWASKASFLDKPQTQQPTAASQASAASPNNTAESNFSSPAPDASVTDSSSSPHPQGKKTTPQRTPAAQEDPFFKPKGGPSEKWQPDSWTPNASQR